jgi:membrane-associated protein
VVKTTGRLRSILLWVGAARLVLGIIALPLAPFLFENHFLVLVLLRPTKEVLLVGGFLAREGRVPLLLLIAAAVPLAILAVWHSYSLGRAYSSEIRGNKITGIASRILPVEKIKKLQKILRKKGWRLVVLGRLAVFPSAMMGAAAGSSNLKSREFLPADAIGGLLSLAEVIGAGYFLGIAYKSAGPWITAAGVAILAAMAILLGIYLRRE